MRIDITKPQPNHTCHIYAKSEGYACAACQWSEMRDHEREREYTIEKIEAEKSVEKLVEYIQKNQSKKSISIKKLTEILQPAIKRVEKKQEYDEFWDKFFGKIERSD